MFPAVWRVTSVEVDDPTPAVPTLISPEVVVKETDVVASGLEPVKSISLLFVKLSVLVTFAEFGERLNELVEVLLTYALTAASDNVLATVLTAPIDVLDCWISPPAVSEVVVPLRLPEP